MTTIRPDGTTVFSDYNGGGLVGRHRPTPTGNTTQFQYDKLGRKTAEFCPYNGVKVRHGGRRSPRPLDRVPEHRRHRRL